MPKQCHDDGLKCYQAILTAAMTRFLIQISRLNGARCGFIEGADNIIRQAKKSARYLVKSYPYQDLQTLVHPNWSKRKGRPPSVVNP